MPLTNTIALLCVLAGYCWLWASFINRFHGNPFPHRWLDLSEVVHWSCVAAGPVIVFYGLGIRFPGLLLGGEWRELSVAGIAFVSLCGIGFLGFCWKIVVYWFRPEPEQLRETSTEVIDFQRQIRRRPIREGTGDEKTPSKESWKMRLPGNQLFQVEFSEKRFELTQLPADFGELRILHISDFHFSGLLAKEFYHAVMERALEMTPDIVVFSGDLVDDPQLLDWIPDLFGQVEAPHGKFYILGNHDWHYADNSEVRSVMNAAGWADLAGKVIARSMQGVDFELGGTEQPWMGEFPKFAQSDGPESRRPFRILVSHTPDNIELASKSDVDLMLSGHTHGGQVKLPLVGPIYTPSLYGTRYSDGTFFESPTLLHVSRGLAGTKPIRINCRPEVTCLVLRGRD